MAEKTNALSELAFRLDAAHTEMIAAEIPKPYRDYLDMAKRIVNEMSNSAYRITVAKSPSGKEVLMYDPQDRMAVISSVYNCRRIAEELDNGK